MSCLHSRGFVHSVIINEGTDEQLYCEAYKSNIPKTVFYYFIILLSGGLLSLLFYWKPNWKVKCTHTRSFIHKADTLIIKCSSSEHIDVTNITIEEVQDGLNSEFVNYDSPLASPISTDFEAMPLNITHKSYIRYFIYQHARYVWDKNSMSFKRLRGLDSEVTCAAFYDMKGFTANEQSQKLAIFGENSIDIQVKSYFRLLIEEVLNPFYIFQIFSILLWALDNYIYYAVCIFVISAISIGVSLYETRKQSVTLRNMISSHNISKVSVCRGELSVIEEISATRLVPGDIIVIPYIGCLMSCDAVLISGNCIVNESMLTGESVPVTKTPLLVKTNSEDIYTVEDYKRHTLFCGTKVIQTRYYDNANVLAVVVHTGFSTAKGELVRAILFPKPMGFKFYQDSIRFILVLGVIASVGMAFSMYLYIKRNAPIKDVILRALDIVTIVVPPALPAAMTVGVVCAQSRLKKQNIFCISPPRINVCGKLKLICFDKTGTLTEEGLDLWGVVTINEQRFQPVVSEPTFLSPGPFINAMATCHSLTMIDGELNGDPLDLKMFLATKWILEEPGKATLRYDLLMPTIVHPPYRLSSAEDYFSEEDLFKQDKTPFEIGIVREFPFSSSLQRMSVITRTLGSKHMDLYAKGAPEQISLLCHAESLPVDFTEVLKEYTIQGFRVLALAWRKLDRKLTWHHAQRIPREQIECELEFLGLLIMQNTLKPETTPVINQLRKANIRTIMITGDNILTAISVARDCNMVLSKDEVVLIKGHTPEEEKPAWIEWEHAELPCTISSISNIEVNVASQLDAYQTVVIEEEKKQPHHFALNGKTFSVLRHYFPDLFPKVLIQATIFGRMSPDQKAQLVEAYQDLGYITAMCGDGANDCGALKAAHAGISLSDAEASVASPFTSKVNNIECVPTLIKEGRCSLVTSFGLFKYMALYSIVQFISVLILYEKQTNLGDFMFLYIDLGIITIVAILMGRTGPYHRLVAQGPSGSLITYTNIASIFIQIVIVTGIQAGSFFYLASQTWFEPLKPDPNIKTPVSWEGTVIFGVSCYQYIILAVVFSKGPPYRKPMYTNVLFMIAVISLTGFTTLSLLQYIPYFTDLLQIKLAKNPDHLIFRLDLLGFSALNFVLSLFLEFLIVDQKLLKKAIKKCYKKIPKVKYKLLENEITTDVTWPPAEIIVAERRTSSSSEIS